MQDNLQKMPYKQYLFAISFSDLRTLFCRKKYLYTFFLAKRICAHFFCRKNDIRAFFVAKTIYSLCPESFCALEVAIRKFQTFWASGPGLHPHLVFDISRHLKRCIFILQIKSSFSIFPFPCYFSSAKNNSFSKFQPPFPSLFIFSSKDPKNKILES